MKKNIITVFTFCFCTSFTAKPKIEKNKFPILGIVISIISTPEFKEFSKAALEYATNYIKSKNIKIVDAQNANRQDVEKISIKIEDKDNDGEIEITTYVEDHNGDGYSDNVLTLEVDGDNEDELLNDLLEKELHYIDDFYDGDIDRDGYN